MRHPFLIVALAILSATLASESARADWRAGIVFDNGSIRAGDGGFAIGIGPRYGWPDRYRPRHRGRDRHHRREPSRILTRPTDRERYRRERRERYRDRYRPWVHDGYGRPGYGRWPYGSSVLIPGRTSTTPTESAPAAPAPKAGTTVKVIRDPAEPPRLSGQSRRYPARGTGPMGSWSAGQRLPADTPYVKLNPGPYGLEDPPAGQVYARLGRQIVLLDPVRRTIMQVLSAEDISVK